MVHVGAPAGAKAAHPPHRRQSPPQRPIRACRRSYRGRERDGPCTHAEARRCMYERLSRRSSYQRRSTMVHVGAPAGAKAAHPPRRRQSPPQRPIRACRRSYRGRKCDGACANAASATVHVRTPKRDGSCTNAEARRFMYQRRSATVHVPTPKRDGPCTTSEARRFIYERRSATVYVGAPAGAKAAHPPRQRPSPPTRPIRGGRRSYRGGKCVDPCTNAEARRFM